MDANELITITLTAAEWERLCQLVMMPVTPILGLVGKIQQQATAAAAASPPAGNGVDAEAVRHVQN